MPVDANGKLLPGQRGKDYVFVKHGSSVYAVYEIRVAGHVEHISFKIAPDEYKAYSVDPDKVHSVGDGQFQRLNFFGNASDVIRNGTEHPWEQYLKKLQQDNGNVSWLHDRQFMNTMLKGWFDGTPQEELQQQLQQTTWYQTRTQTQRAWELNLSKADRTAAVKGTVSAMREQLRTLYGADFDLNGAGLDNAALTKMATAVASGKYGTLDEGMQVWFQHQRTQAENVEGSPAWIDREQQDENQRQFMNRPEDMFQQLKDQAYQYLGPHGMPDDDTLHRWAKNLVTQTSSQGDWEGFLKSQSSAMYPWLSPGETWQDRASAYKNIAEQDLGGPIKWEDPLLSKIGQVDANGQSTGLASSFLDFQKQVRTDPRFWQGPVAANAAYSLFDQLNSTFNGA